MRPLQIKGRRWPTIVLLALAALAIGAIFGTSRNSSAAITVKPSNQTYPTIAGTVQENQTLTAGNGTWSGTTPITFTYQWNRCDQNGKNCAAINGATTNTYTVSHADIGNTLQIAVVGTNSDGTDSQASNPTAVVLAAASTPPLRRPPPRPRRRPQAARAAPGRSRSPISARRRTWRSTSRRSRPAS